jgi:hypothetical protein
MKRLRDKVFVRSLFTLRTHINRNLRIRLMSCKRHKSSFYSPIYPQVLTPTCCMFKTISKISIKFGVSMACTNIFTRMQLQFRISLQVSGSVSLHTHV